MNTAEVDKLGAKPLEPELEAIAALDSSKDLAAFNAKQMRRGGGGFFGIGVHAGPEGQLASRLRRPAQGGLTLPDRDYYLNPSERVRDDPRSSMWTTW